MKKIDPEGKLTKILDNDERSNFHLDFIVQKSVWG